MCLVRDKTIIVVVNIGLFDNKTAYFDMRSSRLIHVYLLNLKMLVCQAPQGCRADVVAVPDGEYHIGLHINTADLQTLALSLLLLRFLKP
ncbi:hypothetical protein L1987_77864 [Smallanthus sonchifolius]|uniref:Uncharacterized protein n=1 Tax=Smallanthus sonchifolius TaxID=185202 RepID=A0ACB8ZA74_9ASTR|nr:hypothetical protein L1987_77864 [Smallanthus sonchifolius]